MYTHTHTYSVFAKSKNVKQKSGGCLQLSCLSSVLVFTVYQMVNLNKSLNCIKPKFLDLQS